MTSDDRTETITDRAAIRDSDEPSERTTWQRLRAGRANAVCGCGCAELPTPAPVGASAGLDLDARADALLRAVETIKATGGAVEIAGVRIEPCDAFGSTVTTARAEAAEAERDALLAKVAAVEALADSPPLIVSAIEQDERRTPTGRGGIVRFTPATVGHGASGCPGDNVTGWLSDLRAALATGEGK